MHRAHPGKLRGPSNQGRIGDPPEARPDRRVRECLTAGLAFGCPRLSARLDAAEMRLLDENRTMPIMVMSWPDETTRTPNGPCFWIAEATVDGQLFRARSRYGVPNALARQLLAARLADRPMVIRYRGLAGAMTYGSFHAAAKWTYTEGASTPVKRVPYREWKPRAPTLTECPETVEGEGQKTRAALFDGSLEPAGSVTPKVGVRTPDSEQRSCAICGRPFRPWRPQATHCSGACRQKAYRQRGKKEPPPPSLHKIRARQIAQRQVASQPQTSTTPEHSSS
jgi:hypothetical protein